MEIITLKSFKFGVDGPQSNYKEPIRAGKVRYKDGTFLYDLYFGVMFGYFAKEIEPKVYKSTIAANHYMYEAEAPKEEE